MRLEQIEIFLELAKELHFWRTAERMHITQSALSRQIQGLEQELGFPLFVRNKRNVKLTTAGVLMRCEWERILEEVGNVHRQAKQISLGEIGTVRIGHPGSISYSLIPDLLAKTSAKYPNLKFDLIEISAMDLDRALLNYKIDIGFNRDFPKNEQLSFELLEPDNFGLFVPEHHRLRSDNFAGLEEARDERFILPSLKNESQYGEALSGIFSAHNFTPRTYIESDFGATILSLVAKGMGIAVMPASYSLHLPKGVRFIELPYRTNLYAVWRKSDDNPVLRNLLALLKPNGRTRLSRSDRTE